LYKIHNCSYLILWRAINDYIELQSNSKRARIDVNSVNFPVVPRLRKKAYDYHPNDTDQIRRAYLQNGHCQQIKHNFPQIQFENTLYCINLTWFKEYDNWLEYNISKDVVYCLFCYLFIPDTINQAGGDSCIT
jgi:hypothetical protein